MTSFPGILFLHEQDAAPEPDVFADLNLDQVVAAITAGREDLAPFFHVPLTDPDAVAYRHEVFADLERPELLAAVEDFAARLAQVRARLALADALAHPPQRQRHLLDAAAAYAEAVRRFAGTQPGSRALRGFVARLREYAASERFLALERRVREIAARLDEVRYTVHVQGQRVRVARAEDEPDYGAELAALFARFEFPARDHRVELATPDALDSVERRILDLVAKLFPDAFAALATADADFLDPDVARFEREIRFYLAYREHMARLALPFCIPELGGELEARDAYDLALATKLEGQGMVLNDVALHGGERVLVITGPNNGGKTSFARMVGGLHHLASLGVPVPARRARLTLPDRIFTHFEREEDAGKLEDDLRRVRAILELASDRSVVILNETFSATAHEDALALGTEVLERLIALGPLTLFVTFVDELSRLGDATVSLVATVDPDDPARRTHRVERRVADGRAYAEAIAAKYGLTYERLAERLAR